MKGLVGCPPLDPFTKPSADSITFGREDTDVNPFHCSVCGLSFGRQDAYRRHLNNSCKGTTRASGGSNRRTPKACNRCRIQKLKCNGDRPCQRCEAKLLNCSYASSALYQSQTSTETTTRASPSVTATQMIPLGTGEQISEVALGHINNRRSPLDGWDIEMGDVSMHVESSEHTLDFGQNLDPSDSTGLLLCSSTELMNLLS